MAKSGALDALIDFAGAMLPLQARNLQTVIDENLSACRLCRCCHIAPGRLENHIQ